MQKKIKKICILIISILLIWGIVRIINTSSIKQIIYKKIYPISYSEYVYKYSEENNIDPLLVFAIIKAESNFNPKIVSKSDAKGLMQLMDSTAEEITEKEFHKDYYSTILFEPEENIKIGTAYFASLLERYNGNIPIALAAYNAGIGKVDNWIKDCIIKEDGSDIENIPYQETNNYVRKILRDYKLYKHIYKE